MQASALSLVLRIHFDCDGRFFGAVNRDYSGPGSWNGHENTLNNRFWVRSPLSFRAEKSLLLTARLLAHRTVGIRRLEIIRA